MWWYFNNNDEVAPIQIQHLLKLNLKSLGIIIINTSIQIQHLLKLNMQTLIKLIPKLAIQIQHLLKLNARKINLYDFHYTIKSIDIQGF